MKRTIKWLLILAGGLLVLIVLAVLVIPVLVDVDQYRPQIERRVSEATGRPFALGGDLDVSIFPWVGVSFSDLHLGSLPGFEEKDLLTVKSFEVRVKLLPLFFKDVQVKRFILEGPHIVLERSKDGVGNWEGIGRASPKASPRPPEEKSKLPASAPRQALPIEALAVGQFAIRDGSVLWIDHVNGTRQEISDLALHLQDVSLNRPIRLDLSARIDGHLVSLDGKVGPVGQDPGKGTVPLHIAVEAVEQAAITLEGEIVDPARHPRFDLALRVPPFSPRKLLAALHQTFPVITANPEAFKHVALKAKLKGNHQNVSVSDGALDLDKSKLHFSVKVKDFSRPDLTFDLKLDQIDLDRYLPHGNKENPPEGNRKANVPSAGSNKANYALLRRLVLDGTVRAGEIKVHGARIQDVELKVSGKSGKFRVDPLVLKLYEGDMSAKAALDVRHDTPKSNLEIDAKGIQVGSLLHDAVKKDFLEGTVKASLALRMVGDNPKAIKGTLNGHGNFLFQDGAIKGIDLAGMARNMQSAFGLGGGGVKRLQTDFSELHAPFTVTGGVIKTPGARLMSPLLRVIAVGKANLVKETLDFRVEPKFVATLKGQGDTMERAGVMVPVLVTGDFSSPKFRPDLKGMLKQGLREGLFERPELKKILPGQTGQEGESTSFEEKTTNFLKDLGVSRNE